MIMISICSASVEQKKIGDMDGSGIVPDQSTAGTLDVA